MLYEDMKNEAIDTDTIHGDSQSHISNLTPSACSQLALSDKYELAPSQKEVK
jgi:hypothetical protein